MLELLTVEKALAYSFMKRLEKTSHLHSIYNCTSSILFFGTPHHGADRAAMMATMVKLARGCLPIKRGSFENDLISALEVESETLQNITDHFIGMMKRFNIYFFWEEERTDLKYAREYIVSSDSAAPSLPDIQKAGIAANHSDMVKFDGPSAPGWRMVVAALQTCADGAPDFIRQRVDSTARLIAQERREEALENIGQLQPLVPPPATLSAKRHATPSLLRIEEAVPNNDFSAMMREEQLEDRTSA
jgi:hypothetical protein